VYNGYAYKSLADHKPFRQETINEWNKMYVVESPWELCPNTSDARHVCGHYPWATYALVLADGASYWTKQAPSCMLPNVPGAQAAAVHCLKQHIAYPGKYGTGCAGRWDDRIFESKPSYHSFPSYCSWPPHGKQNPASICRLLFQVFFRPQQHHCYQPPLKSFC
jgi:hypothetical protein